MSEIQLTPDELFKVIVPKKQKNRFATGTTAPESLLTLSPAASPPFRGFVFPRSDVYVPSILESRASCPPAMPICPPPATSSTRWCRRTGPPPRQRPCRVVPRRGLCGNGGNGTRRTPSGPRDEASGPFLSRRQPCSECDQKADEGQVAVNETCLGPIFDQFPSSPCRKASSAPPLITAYRPGGRFPLPLKEGHSRASKFDRRKKDHRVSEIGCNSE